MSAQGNYDVVAAELVVAVREDVVVCELEDVARETMSLGVDRKIKGLNYLWMLLVLL